MRKEGRGVGMGWVEGQIYHLYELRDGETYEGAARPRPIKAGQFVVGEK